MQKTRHSGVSIRLRSVKRSAFLFVLFLFFFFLAAKSVFAGVTQNVSCPPVSSTVSEVLITYNYKTSVNITLASNSVSMVLPETPTGAYVYDMKIKALATAAGFVPLTNSANIVTPTSCVAALPEPLQAVSENFLMGLAGSITAGLFVFALLKSAL